MPALHIRHAGAWPGVDEYYARLGSTAIGDEELSDAALRCLAGINLAIAEERGRGHALAPGICTATNHELGRLTGKRPRTITRLLAELAAQGHVTLEPLRTITGAPRGIRPLASLRPKRTREPTLTTQDTQPPTPEVTTDVAKSEGTAPRLADVLTDPDLATALGAQRGPGVIRQDPPGAEARNSVPDAKDCTREPEEKSRREPGVEHNLHYRTSVGLPTWMTKRGRFLPPMWEPCDEGWVFASTRVRIVDIAWEIR